MKLLSLVLSCLSLIEALPAQQENSADPASSKIVQTTTEAQPNATLHFDAGLTCERYGAVRFEKFNLYNDLWNQPVGIGRQCTGRGITPESWFTKWSWAQASRVSQVISYANVELALGTREPIAGLGSVRSVWHATYRGIQLSANVAFDIFVAPPGGGEQIEIMAWVKQYGTASPISSSAYPIAEVNLPSGKWALWKGRNSYSRMDVYSFVRSDARVPGPMIYEGDVLEFIHHLVYRGTIRADWHLIKIGAGTEATTGLDCLFVTSLYTLNLVRK